MKSNLSILTVFLAFFAMTQLTVAQIGELEFLPPDTDDSEYAEYHKVQNGETLFQISKKHGVSVDYLKALNNLESNIIFPGQSLIVKTGSARSINQRVAGPNQKARNLGVSDEIRERNLAKLKEEDFTSNPEHRRILSDLPQENTTEERYTNIERRTYYQVREGDDIYSIANKYDVSPGQIKTWNGITRVYPGQAIIVGKRYEKANIEELEKDNYPDAFPNQRIRERNISEIIEPEPERLEKTGSLASLNSRTEMKDNMVDPYYKKYTIDNSALGNTIEEGSFRKFVDPNYRGTRFYAEHKTLPPGTRISLLIPNNAGFVEVEIIRTSSPFNKEMIGLSPSCLNLIDGAGGAESVTIIY